MKFAYKGQFYEIDHTDDKLTIDNETFPLRIEEYNNNILKVTINGEQKVVYVAYDERNFYVSIDGEQYTFQQADETLDIEEKDNGSSKNIEYIKPPMPGSVVKVLVEQGQNVDEGSPIIVVEAMKMEITLYSSIQGVITEINVEPGQQVDADKVLVVIKRNEND